MLVVISFFWQLPVSYQSSECDTVFRHSHLHFICTACQQYRMLAKAPPSTCCQSTAKTLTAVTAVSCCWHINSLRAPKSNDRSLLVKNSKPNLHFNSKCRHDNHWRNLFVSVMLRVLLKFGDSKDICLNASMITIDAVFVTLYKL